MELDAKKISREVMEKLATCQSEEEVIAVAKENGVEITAEQARAFMDEMKNFELNEKALDQVAGGESVCWDCSCYNRICNVDS